MGVASLGHAPAGLGLVGKLVAIDDGDRVEMVGQHTGGGETGHARADDDGVAAKGAGHQDPFEGVSASYEEPAGTVRRRCCDRDHPATG